MTRRWFQFSLRTAIVLTLIVAVALGVYIRWPYYCAEELLDAAGGDKSFPEWPRFRAALIHEAEFRDWAVSMRSFKLHCTVDPPNEGHFALNVGWHEWWRTHLKPNGELERPELFNAYE